MTRTAPAGRTLRFITALSARLTCPKPNARPIRHNGQVPDRNGKIFYTSITSLSHISKIVWLETGNDASGLQHIIKEHGSQFNGKGISNENIPNYVLEAVYQWNVVGTQGKKNPPRTIYEFTYNGIKQRIAVQVSKNGYIVGANPKSMKE